MPRVRSVSFSSEDEDLKEFQDPETTKDFSKLVKDLLREYKGKSKQTNKINLTKEEIRAVVLEILEENNISGKIEAEGSEIFDPDLCGAIGDILNLGGFDE